MNRGLVLYWGLEFARELVTSHPTTKMTLSAAIALSNVAIRVVPTTEKAQPIAIKNVGFCRLEEGLGSPHARLVNEKAMIEKKLAKNQRKGSFDFPKFLSQVDCSRLERRISVRLTLMKIVILNRLDKNNMIMPLNVWGHAWGD
jgi:hypothetical protein